MSYIIHISGGGIFSLMHQFFETVLNNIKDIDKISDLKIIIENHRFITNNFIFDNIFVNKNINTSNNIFLCPCKNSFLQANLFERFNDLKKINNKLLYNEFIIEQVNKYVNSFNIDENTFGIHIRLTDMNSMHPEYGNINIEKYIENTKIILNRNKNINKLFIASDNYESINIFENEFPNIIIHYIDNNNRVNLINDNNFEYQISKLNDKDFIINNFIENIILSKCCGLLHRISDFSNYAIINSNTFKIIICIK